jgi:hypothetical protein
LRDLIPAWLLSAEEEGLNSRERVFSLRLTFECFLWQVLNPSTSCREVTRHVQALFQLAGAKRVHSGDSAYVQARSRLPRERFDKALAAIARAATQKITSSAGLQNRPVKAVDGSTTQLPDTVRNQQRYPQPSTQKKGCGFPVMKFVVLFCLQSGAILNVAMGSLGLHELRLFRSLWPELKRGDILLGDRGFSGYGTVAGLLQLGIDVAARLHGARKVDFRKTKRLGKKDGLFVWERGYQQSTLFSAKQWQGLPAQIVVRILRMGVTIRGFRNRRLTMVTTLLDPTLYPAQELFNLYARRWRLELCLRDVKSTLGLEQLRCKTPDMAEKELLAYLITHNLVRCIMGEAAINHAVKLEFLSFKGTLDSLRQYSAAMCSARSQKMRRQLWQNFLLTLVQDLVPHRPGRSEPRAVKRRPKPHPLLNKARRQFKEIPHRNRYWKGRPRNYRGLN